MIEIDYLPASHEKKSGDCILMRLGNISYDNPDAKGQKIILIDSGYSECSKKIKEYLQEYYSTSVINYVFITHPDQDHISGLNELLDDDDITIEKIIIHDPWNHTKEVFKRTKDGRRTRNSIAGNFEDTLKILDHVFEKIERKRISTCEAFAGNILKIGDYVINILGPQEKYYEWLLTQFPGMENESSTSSDSVYEDVESDWFYVNQYFLDLPQTSAKNNSSMVLLLSRLKRNDNGEMRQEPFFLFTGDAGTEALRKAIWFANYKKIPLQNCDYLQLPHHGSIKNINDSLISSINAEKYVVSAAENDEEHPSRLLVNYINDELEKQLFHIENQNGIRFSAYGAPARPGWSTANSKARFEKVFKLKGDK